MEKAKVLAKYELLNLVRSKLFWIMAVLYFLGFFQFKNIMFEDGVWKGGLIFYLKFSWLPLNFMMFPLLLIGYRIGKSKSEIIEVLDISAKERILGKCIPMIIISLVIFLVSLIVAGIVAIVSKVSLEYFLYLFGIYIISVAIFLMVVCAIGMSFGILLEGEGLDVLGFIGLIFIFAVLTSFGKGGSGLLPLFLIPSIGSTFKIREYDMKFWVEVLFWLSNFSLLAFFIIKKVGNIKVKKFNSIVITACLVLLSVCLGKESLSLEYPYYAINRKKDPVEGFENIYETTYYADTNIGYYVSKYNMNIIFDNYINNKCTMDITITNDNINNIDLGLFYKFDVTDVKVNGKHSKYERIDNKVIVDLEEAVNKGEKLNIEMFYEGNPDVKWLDDIDMFFVNKNSVFLGDVYEWYPKLNDDVEKEYEINVSYKGKNKLYSNLDMESEGKYVGSSQEIYFLSGNISEKEYKGYTFIGNEENFSTIDDCENGIKELNFKVNPPEELKKYMKPLKDGSKVNKIIYVPFMPGANENISYNNSILIEGNDKSLSK